jgi:hypothetical protein
MIPRRPSRHGRAASASSGVYRCTHRQTVKRSTSTPRSASSSSRSRSARPKRGYKQTASRMTSDEKRRRRRRAAEGATGGSGERSSRPESHRPDHLTANATEPSCLACELCATAGSGSAGCLGAVGGHRRRIPRRLSRPRRPRRRAASQGEVQRGATVLLPKPPHRALGRPQALARRRRVAVGSAYS